MLGALQPCAGYDASADPPVQRPAIQPGEYVYEGGAGTLSMVLHQEPDRVVSTGVLLTGPSVAVAAVGRPFRPRSLVHSQVVPRPRSTTWPEFCLRL